MENSVQRGVRPAAAGEGPAGDVVVDVRGLHKSFGATHVLKGVTFTIRDNEFVALLGRSGGGKTTLLRILEGLESHWTGEVLVPGRRSVVFQEPRLLPWKKVAENVVFGLSGRRTDLQRTALTALEEVGLEDRANVWPATLSGGEQQRVGLSRALVRQPQLLLLDEPFGALDALTRLKMHALLRELVSKHRPGVLMVTHDVQEALDLADRILVLDQGEIDIDIDVGQARRHSDPQAAIDGLRHQILTSLGVTSQ